MKTHFLYICLAGILSAVNAYSQHSDICINEVMYSNKSTLQVYDNSTPDWIELYNSSQEIVTIKGWGITDNSLKKFKYTFPDIRIHPGEYLLIFAADKESGDTSNSIYTQFELRANRESVFLYNHQGILIDSVFSPCVPSDRSLGRLNDEIEGELVVFKQPTPGKSNTGAEVLPLDFKRDMLVVSHESGFYDHDFHVTLHAGHPENKIYYTLDGSTPDEGSEVYLNPILIYNKTKDENIYSAIPYMKDASVPKNKVFKGAVLRAQIYNEGCPASDEITRTFFVDETMTEKYHVPIVSITTDPDNFFDDDEGIYIHGNNNNCMQRGKEWEREVRFEYFSPEGELHVAQNVGIRIHGRGSRMGPQKSLKIYARDEYGKDVIDYPFFENRKVDKYKSLILRTTAGDWSNTLFTDDLCHALLRNMDIDYMETKPVVVFLNGEYWGVHNLRERQDRYYLRNSFEEDYKVNIISYERYDGPVAEDGGKLDYNELLDYLSTHDLSIDEYYEYAKEFVDINNLIDYFIAQLYFANADFPDLNQRMWKTDEADSKWRWYFFDCDGCMWRVNYDLLYQYSNIGEEYTTYPQWSIILFKKFLQNDTFRTTFYQRFIHVLATDLSTHTVLQQIDYFENRYEPLVREHVMRWEEPLDFNKWTKDVDELRGFALQRPAEILEQLRDKMGVPFEIGRNDHNGGIYIEFPGNESVPVKIKILDSMGRLMFEEESNGGQNHFEANIDLPVGIYYVQMVYGNINFTSKYLSLK